MTVIAAAAWGGRAAIASDRSSVDVDGMHRDHGRKVFRIPAGAVGFSGSYDVPQVWLRVLRDYESLESRRQVIHAAEAMATACAELGWKREVEGNLPQLNYFVLLIVTKGGRIWSLWGDFVPRRDLGFGAIGSGQQFAMGALRTARKLECWPKDAVRLAVDAAIEHSSSCGSGRTLLEVR